MIMETRQFAITLNPLTHRKQLLFICENEEESKILDEVFGDVVDKEGIIAQVIGVVKLADGFREHYIRIENKNGSQAKKS